MGNHTELVEMKTSLLFLAFALSCTTSSDIDPLDDIDEKDFRQFFHLEPINDPVEFAKREQALKKHEAKIKEVNEQYLRGEKSWFAKVNDFADLPDELFMARKTGLVHFEENPEQVPKKVADLSRIRRSIAPESYSSVDLGLVTPVKDQYDCGSCVAFATTAAIETCFAKLTGHLDDYSEQQLIDCAYGNDGANACDGSSTHSYLKWTSENEGELTHESLYPYLNTDPNLVCPKLNDHRRGAKVSNYSYIQNGNEELLKSLVYQHGAVIASVHVRTHMDLWNKYGGDIFDDCTVPTSIPMDHVVTVVGYGSENGSDYWLVKNSWGKTWGNQGLMKLKRGVGMCGIGKDFATVSCEKVAGPTDAPLTAEVPCYDKWKTCPDLARNYCYQEQIAKGCIKSCGLCKGMNPAASNTCYDTWRNCPEIAQTDCYQEETKQDCKRSCGLCKGMTPVASNTCYDMWGNCPETAQTHCYQEGTKQACKKSCGLCEGMTPVASNTCYDVWSNCPEMAATANNCSHEDIARKCKKSCGLCKGMIP